VARGELGGLGVVDLRAGDVGGQEVRGKRDACVRGAHGARESADRERFGESGDAFDEDVAVTEERDEEAVDQVLLTDDDATNLGSNGGEEAGLLFDAGVDRLDVDRQTTPPRNLDSYLRVYTSAR
jgi:hypothetical protein